MLKVYGIPTDRENRHIAARTLLRWKYEELWQRPMPEIAIGENGRPFFPDEEAYFSISHTKGLSFCALCDGGVGLDVEKIRSIGTTAVQKILSPQEWLRYSCSENPAEMFMKFWTLKEAYFKFLGEGIRGDLSAASFDLSGDRPVCSAAPELYFWCRRTGDCVLSVCADRFHRPELYMEEI